VIQKQNCPKRSACELNLELDSLWLKASVTLRGEVDHFLHVGTKFKHTKPMVLSLDDRGNIRKLQCLRMYRNYIVKTLLQRVKGLLYLMT